ncbi:hypothetical protein [Paracoccus pacificus]|uniref:Uncharacterized protein n=1 Tax=Paracoccus pacificus TaxID=1463598 RepID=A0ABW4R647_9RHOB
MGFNFSDTVIGFPAALIGAQAVRNPSATLYVQNVTPGRSFQRGYWQSPMPAQHILHCEDLSGLTRRFAALRKSPGWAQLFADDAGSSPIAFINEGAARRPDALLSDWHRGLIATRRRQNRLGVCGAVILLSVALCTCRA